ncbi:hypothetical protein SZ64_00690 [Erythrobacter sp. SG61-1L]|uniref:hypothetical protein n=1 Tax=Erythrobacter sp. SG61-1L TaxID=1603897 RepID=UPI0006C8E701|nr:hypothetical protein [Erythrobacter sp. SG61-1L]KPL66746.1 hypothetical protein SZ64_00690 [Erythrobacter sp. SG61-1L]
MAGLRLFGWTLPLEQSGDTYIVGHPTEHHDGDTYWDQGSFVLVPENGRYSAYLDWTALRLAGLVVRIEIENLGLEKIGEDFRPKRGNVAGEVKVRFSNKAGAEALLRFGPVALPAVSYSLFFDKDDPRALGRFSTASDWCERGATDESVAPLALRIPDGRGLLLDLANREFILPEGSLRATLSSRRPADIDAPRPALFLNRDDIPVPFAKMREGRAEDLTVRFEKTDDTPVILNADPRDGKHAIEVTIADLDLTLREPGGGAAGARGGPNSILARADLAPPPDGELVLRFLAIRNSRNRAEEWATSDRVRLGFRKPVGNDRRCVLIQPEDEREPRRKLPEFHRLKGNRQTGGQTRHLPMHSWFGNSHLVMAEATRMQLRCSRDSSSKMPGQDASIPDDNLWSFTRPWLQIENAKLRQGRPGDAFRGGEASASWMFEGPAGAPVAGIPALHRKSWEIGGSIDGNARLRHANALVDGSFKSMKLLVREAVHESGLKDVTAAAPGLKAIVPDGRLPIGEIQLETHGRMLEISAPRPVSVGVERVKLEIPFSVPQMQSADFVLFWPGWGSTLTFPKLTPGDFKKWGPQLSQVIDEAAPIKLVADLPDANWLPEFPRALVKLGRRKGLKEILDELRAAISHRPDANLFDAKRTEIEAAIRETNPELFEPSWLGVVLFDAPIDFSDFAVLEALVPTNPEDAPRFSFFALAPRSPDHDADVAISAAVHWSNDSDAWPGQSGEQYEAALKPLKLDAGFRDNRLVNFSSKARLRLYSFLAVKGAGANDTKDIDILGSVRQTGNGAGSNSAYEVRFAAEVRDNKRLTLFPVGDGKPDQAEKFFVESVWLRRLEVVDRPATAEEQSDPSVGKRRAEIQIDGSIEFNKDLKGFGGLSGAQDFFQGLRSVSFANLRVDLTALTGKLPRDLKLKYPSLQFDLNLPHVSLLGNALRLKFQQLVIDWPDSLPSLNLGDFVDIGSFPRLDPKLPKILFLGQLDFGDLPDLFARKLSSFSLEGVFGFNFKNGLLSGNPFIGMRGFGFSGLNLDLANFFTLRIKQLSLKHRSWKNPPGPDVSGAALTLEGGDLSILKYKVFENLNGGYFSLKDDRGDGFWALFERPVKFPLLEFHWAFAAQNVDFPPEVAKLLLAPPKIREGDDPGGGDDGDSDVSGMGGKLADYWKDGVLRPALGRKSIGWTFAASISALEDALQGRALFQDGGFMGLALNGGALSELFGWDFAFVGLYRKDITPGEDYFYFSVTLPPITFSTIHFTGGEIAAELYTSGDFAIDFGFPWQLSRGGRAWERTIGAIVTPGQASGGWYVRKREHMVPQGKQLVIAAGIAIQWGLGAAFGGGTFKAWVRIGVYGILEGQLTLLLGEQRGKAPRITAIHVQGAAGILVEGQGEIDWWVINVSVGVRATAEVRVAIAWVEGNDVVHMHVEAELSVSAYARACIGPRWARICKGISVGLSIPVKHTLEFG